MYQSSVKVEWPILKLELLIIQVPKFGKICHITENATFGL
jgi:hypothetical protein